MSAFDKIADGLLDAIAYHRENKKMTEPLTRWRCVECGFVFELRVGQLPMTCRNQYCSAGAPELDSKRDNGRMNDTIWVVCYYAEGELRDDAGYFLSSEAAKKWISDERKIKERKGITNPLLFSEYVVIRLGPAIPQAALAECASGRDHGR